MRIGLVARRRRPLSLIERDRFIERTVGSLPGPVSERLLEALMLSAGERAELIGRLHTNDETRSFAERLIDLEEDRQLALDLGQALKEQTRGSP